MPVYDVVRLLVLAGLVAAITLALASWAVTSRRISPFSRLARLVRRLSDPVVVPLERFVLRRGGNPRNAPWWLLGIAIGAGILTLTLTQWLLQAAARFAAAAGPRGGLRLTLYLAGQALGLALLVRVVGSWFGADRHRRGMRPLYAATDWMVRPLRRFVPPLGAVDITPLVAWLLLQVVVALLMRWV